MILAYQQTLSTVRLHAPVQASQLQVHPRFSQTQVRSDVPRLLGLKIARPRRARYDAPLLSPNPSSNLYGTITRCVILSASVPRPDPHTMPMCGLQSSAGRSFPSLAIFSADVALTLSVLVELNDRADMVALDR